MITPGLRPVDGNHLIVLDQGVRQEPLAHLRHLRRVVHVQLDQPPHVHVLHSLEAKRRKRTLHGLALRVQYALLGADQDARPHAERSSHASNGSPVIRSYASTYSSRVRAITSSGSAGAGGVLSHPDPDAQSRTYCLSKLGWPWPGS